MPDGAQTPTGRGFGGLTPLDEFFERCLPKRNGKPLTRRARNVIIKKHGIRVIRLGNNAFVDEGFEAQRLRDIAQRDILPRGPGRPRKYGSGAAEAPAAIAASPVK